MSDYMTFENLYQEVERAITQGSGSKRDLIKMVINQVYLSEVCVCDDVRPLFWLVDLIDNVLTKDSAALTAITKANPAAVTSASHGFVTGDIIQFGTVTGMTELSNRTVVVVRTSADAYTLKDLNGAAIDASGYTAVGTAGTAYHRGVTLAKNLMKIESFAWMGYNGQVDPAGFDEIESNTAFMDQNTTSRPTRHLFKSWFDTSGNELPRVLWFCLPDDNYQARIWGAVRPAVLSATTDIPNMPFQFHRTIVAGAIARLAEYNVQVENAVIWPQLYQAQLAAIRSFNREWWNKQDRSDVRRGPYLA